MAFATKKPEVYLQRANEFCLVGKDQDALICLYEFIRQFRSRYRKWSETYEMIMMKFVELCVDYKNIAFVKDGLYQYKNLTQQDMPGSLGNVLEQFMDLAEQKTLYAQKTSFENIGEIGDLEGGIIPETLLLSSVTGEMAQDRMDRTVLSPWMRFLWDAYRNLLELLKHNVYVEQLYQAVIHRVFSFCVKYQRKGEFRRLCENLRFHLQKLYTMQENIDQHTNKPPAYLIRLNNVDSQRLLLEARFAQIDTAIKLELWHEAFKSAVDAHVIMRKIETMSKERKGKPVSYANFFDKMATIFFQGENMLFHAAALLQKFSARKATKKVTNEEMEDEANRLLLSALSITAGVKTSSALTKILEIEDLQSQNKIILTTMLRLPEVPSRLRIMKEIDSLSIYDFACESVKKLYKVVQEEQNALQMASKVQFMLAVVKKMNKPDYDKYEEHIMRAVAVKIMKQLSFLHDSMALEEFVSHIPFFDQKQLELLIVNLSKHGYGKFQVDHQKRLIAFEYIDGTFGADFENDFDDGEYENGELHSARFHIENLYNGMEELVVELEDDKLLESGLQKIKHHIGAYVSHRDAERAGILQRQSVIEKYKEDNEQTKKQKDLDMQAEALAREELLRDEEHQRLKEFEEKERHDREIANKEEVKKRIKDDHIRKMQQNPIYQHLVLEKGEEAVRNMDMAALEEEQLKRLESERRAQQEKLHHQEKKFDHTVRAFHLAEIDIRRQILEERNKVSAKLFEAYEDASFERAVLFNRFLVEGQLDAEQFLQNILQQQPDKEEEDTNDADK